MDFLQCFLTLENTHHTHRHGSQRRPISQTQRASFYFKPANFAICRFCLSKTYHSLRPQGRIDLCPFWMTEESKGTISADRLCSLTGLTDRRHRQLAKEGYFPPPM